MNEADQTDSKAREDAATHHSRYPARLHSHLEAAANAAESLSAAELPESVPPSADELVGRYGATESPEGVLDE